MTKLCQFRVDQTYPRVFDLVRDLNNSRKILLDVNSQSELDPCKLLNSAARGIPLGTVTTIPQPVRFYVPTKPCAPDPTPSSDIVIDGVQRLEIFQRAFQDPEYNTCFNLDTGEFEVCSDPEAHHIRTYEFGDALRFFKAGLKLSPDLQEALELVRSSTLFAPITVNRILGVSCIEDISEIRQRLNL